MSISDQRHRKILSFCQEDSNFIGFIFDYTIFYSCLFKERSKVMLIRVSFSESNGVTIQPISVAHELKMLFVA